MLQDMIHVYFAMLQYYILRCPYSLMIFLFVTEVFFPVGMVLRVMPWCIGWLIRNIQWCLYQISRLFPVLQDICSKIDSVFNSWGLRLEGSGNMDESGRQKRKKGTSVIGIYVLIIVVAYTFLIVPYYLESSLTGNSQRVCANINQLVEERVTYVKDYVNRYYTPKISEETVSEETVSEETEEVTETVEEKVEEERIVLHLGSKGRDGSNLRSSPEKRSDNIVSTVYGDIELFFEYEIQKTGGITWVKVSTDEISEVWISRNLLDEEEAETFLYFEE